MAGLSAVDPDDWLPGPLSADEGAGGRVFRFEAPGSERTKGPACTAAGLGQRLLRRRHAGLHLALRKNPLPHHLAEQRFEQPRHAILMAVQRTLDEVGQVIASLGKVPVAELFIARLQTV